MRSSLIGPVVSDACCDWLHDKWYFDHNKDILLHCWFVLVLLLVPRQAIDPCLCSAGDHLLYFGLLVQLISVFLAFITPVFL